MYFDKREQKFKRKEMDENSTNNDYYGRLIGTAEYVSPEMLNNTVENELSSDLWALGCIIYKFFHGKTPFKGTTELNIFDNILNNRYTLNKV